jgi:riboflavin kinase/FMN adenylyltransferase
LETIYLEEPFIGKREEYKPCVMALGFFDGVHLGHQALIHTAKSIARKEQLELAVMSFFPHPSSILPVPNKITRYLSPLPEKKRLLEAMGVEKLYIVAFTEPFARLSPADFIERYVIGLHGAHVVAGFDFTYGYKGRGNMESIKTDGKGFFDVTAVPKKVFRNEKISSTKIRALLDEGKVEQIDCFLGRPYTTSGMAIKQLFDKADGKTLAHITMEDYYLPKKGVYDVQIISEGKTYDAACFLHHAHSVGIMLDGNMHFRSPVTIKWLKSANQLLSSEQTHMAI